MSVFIGTDAYKKEARKERKNFRKKNIVGDSHCPRVCQQTKSGSKGRKTYDSIEQRCNACGYKK
jgi:hypothetical protein